MQRRENPVVVCLRLGFFFCLLSLLLIRFSFDDRTLRPSRACDFFLLLFVLCFALIFVRFLSSLFSLDPLLLLSPPLPYSSSFSSRSFRLVLLSLSWPGLGEDGGGEGGGTDADQDSPIIGIKSKWSIDWNESKIVETRERKRRGRRRTAVLDKLLLRGQLKTCRFSQLGQQVLSSFV